VTIFDNVWNAFRRSIPHASSHGDGRPVVTSELIESHRRLAHEMRNAAIRAAAARILRGLRRSLCRSEEASPPDKSTLPEKCRNACLDISRRNYPREVVGFDRKAHHLRHATDADKRAARER
jgi:hypothetical protein